MRTSENPVKWKSNFRECPECERRQPGVLRSSSWGGGTLERKEGDIVLLLPAFSNEGVELPQEKVPQRSLLSSVLCYLLPKPGEAEHLALGVVGLYQAVAIEEGYFAGVQDGLLLLIAHLRHEPQGHSPSLQLLGVTVTVEVGRVVAGVGVSQGTALWV